MCATAAAADISVEMALSVGGCVTLGCAAVCVFLGHCEGISSRT